MPEHSLPRFVGFAVRLAAVLLVVSLAGCPSSPSSGGSGSGSADTNTNTNDNGTGDANQNDNGAGSPIPGDPPPNTNDNGSGASCGDGNLDAGEACDDGNLAAGDGCDANCEIENNGNNDPICGDGTRDAGEECDDGNTEPGDGCAADCRTEDGGGTDPVCGDGTRDGGEECDDGNNEPGDGCAADCRTEDGGGTDPLCGDGTLDRSEECDDGNNESGDGCDTDCRIEDNGAVCGDGMQDAGEECDDGNTAAGDGCDADCRIEDGGGGGGGGGGNGGGTDPVCGDGTLGGTEECDDGNTVSGDGCDAGCRIENGGGGPRNDSCSAPQTVTEGTIEFVNEGATTDSISVVETCSSANPIEWAMDVWFRYEATCTGTATLSLCGSRYDTTAAVYMGGGCPSEAALVCNDDGCGSGADLPSSRLTFPAEEGTTYLIRIGGYVGESGPATGTGSLTIFCGNASGRGPANCGSGASDCFTVDSSPTCSDADCCSRICALDPFCCDVEWDSVCVEEGIGICGDGFAACTGATGDCFSEHLDQSAGCETSGCCQSVCEEDPFCCLDFWDEFCAQAAVLACSATEVCADATGSCFSTHSTPGCGTQICCESVCLEDPFCCTTEWDAACVDLAASCR